MKEGNRNNRGGKGDQKQRHKQGDDAVSYYSRKPAKWNPQKKKEP